MSKLVKRRRKSRAVLRCGECGAREPDFGCPCSVCLGPYALSPEDRCPVYHEDVDDCPKAPCKVVDACGYCGSCDHVTGAEWIPYSEWRKRAAP